jgi:hypothetical protein
MICPTSQFDMPCFPTLCNVVYSGYVNFFFPFFFSSVLAKHLKELRVPPEVGVSQCLFDLHERFSLLLSSLLIMLATWSSLLIVGPSLVPLQRCWNAPSFHRLGHRPPCQGPHRPHRPIPKTPPTMPCLKLVAHQSVHFLRTASLSSLQLRPMSPLTPHPM